MEARLEPGQLVVQEPGKVVSPTGWLIDILLVRLTPKGMVPKGMTPKGMALKGMAPKG